MTSPTTFTTRPSTDEVRGRLQTRLDEVAGERPDLVAALSLQRVLLGREIDLLEAFLTGGLPSLSLPAGYLAAKLGRGIPALHGEPIPLPLRLLVPGLREFCERLTSAGTADAIAAVIGALDEGGLDLAALLSACFGRDQQRVRLMAGRHGVSADLLWLVSELALAPFAHLLYLQVLVRPAATSGALDAALAKWNRGFCPACGSWPAVIECGHTHVLRCSFCACGWELHPYRCLYCGNDADSFVTAAVNPEQPGRRLQLCGACRGYAKVLETATPTVFPLVAIEDLASLDLDMAAIEREYLRPALPHITKT